MLRERRAELNLAFLSLTAFMRDGETYTGQQFRAGWNIYRRAARRSVCDRFRRIARRVRPAEIYRS